MFKVIIADDEKFQREGLELYIPWTDFDMEVVGSAEDGEEAFELVKIHNPDILITDIKMPLIDGLELSRRIRELLPKSKIIIISGYEEFEYARTAIDFNAYAYILKPINMGKMRQMLGEIASVLQSERQVEEEISDMRKRLEAYREAQISERQNIIPGRKAGKNSHIVDAIIKMVEGRYYEQLTIDEIAKNVYLTPSYICNLFKEDTGESIIDYLTKVRLRHAQKFLADPALKIYEVAEQSGFNSTSYFSIVFKNAFGINPKDYRSSILNNG